MANMTAHRLAEIIHQGLKMIVALLEKELKTTREAPWEPQPRPKQTTQETHPF